MIKMKDMHTFIKRNLTRFFPIIFVLFIVVIIILFIFLIKTKNELNEYKKNTPVSPLEISNLIKEVGNLLILPNDEVPTVATVTDPEKLANQLFFKEAKIGDKVLIYNKAQKVILYDPNLKKIIEVAPINSNNSESNSTSITNIK